MQENSISLCIPSELSFLLFILCSFIKQMLPYKSLELFLLPGMFSHHIVYQVAHTVFAWFKIFWVDFAIEHLAK